MKKILLTILVASIIPTSIFAQNKQFKKLFKEYENVPGFEVSIGSSDADFDFDFDSDVFEMLNNIKDIYIINYEGDMNGQKYSKFKAKFDKLIKNGDYNTLMDISNDGTFKILIQRDSNDSPIGLAVINEDDDDAVYVLSFN